MKLTPLVRVTKPTLLVLECLAKSNGAIWGMSLMKATGLKSGTMYPLLERLETSGWVTSEWEVESDRVGARRRLYRLTQHGVTASQELLENQAVVSKKTSIKEAKLAKAH